MDLHEVSRQVYVGECEILVIFSFVGRFIIPNILTWLAIMNRLSNKGNQDSWGYGDLNFCQKLKHVTLKAGMNNILYDYGIFFLKGSRSFFLSLTGCSKDFFVWKVKLQY